MKNKPNQSASSNHLTETGSEGSPQPPRWADRLLQWFVAPHLLEYVQGNLQELFHKRLQQVSLAQARREYVWAVLHCLTPFLAKRPASRQFGNKYPTPFLFSSTMIRNYLKIAWRNLARNQAYSTISMGGLTLGMAVAMLIGWWRHD